MQVTKARITMHDTICFRYAGILSAYGMALADVVHEAQEPCAWNYSPDNFVKVDERITVLTQQCIEELQRQGFDKYVSIVKFIKGGT